MHRIFVIINVVLEGGGVCVNLPENFRQVFFLEFLSAFAKLRKATVSFVMSAWINSAPTGQIFVQFNVSVLF